MNLEIITEFNAEMLAFEPAFTAGAPPSPSVAELAELAAVMKPDLRIIKCRRDRQTACNSAIPGELAGVAVCDVQSKRVHGVNCRVYQLFGGTVHDYQRIHASDPETIKAIFDVMVADAKAQRADLLFIPDFIQCPDIRHYPGGYCVKIPTALFFADRSANGWDYLLERNSGKREWKRAARLPGFACETHIGVTPADVELVGNLHKERWTFEGQPSAFQSPRRFAEYLAHPGNKIFTTISAQGEILGCHYGMIYGDAVLFHTPVINIKYMDLSPLKLIVAGTAMFCKENGLNCFDFGLGSESYKDSYANAERDVFSVMIPLSVKGRLVTHFSRAGWFEKVRQKLVDLRRMLRARTVTLPPGIKQARAGGELSFQILDTYEAFVDFCRMHKIDVVKQHYLNYKKKQFVAAALCEGTCCGYGWYLRPEAVAPVTAVEFVGSAKIAKNVLAHVEKMKEAQRSGIPK